MRILTLSLHSPAGLVFFFIFAHYITLSVGTTFKRTIDDTLGDSESGALPVYDPTDGFSLNSNCTACTLHPDPAGAFDHTWHDGSQLPDGVPVSVSLSFDGIAITLFCTLANNASEEGIMTSDFAFMLDGVTQKPFTHVPDNTSDFMYRVPVFSVTGLDRGTHNVVMATNNPTGSLMLFDFAQYTFDDGIAPASSVTTTVTNTVTSPATSSPVSSTAISVSSTAISVSPSSSASEKSDTSSPLSSPSLSLASSPTSASPSAISSVINNNSSPPPSSVPSTSRKQVHLAAVLAGTLTPVLCLALVGAIIMCKRRHARYERQLEETRVHSPETEWARLYNPEQPLDGRIPTDTRILGAAQNQFSTRPGKGVRVGEPSPAAPQISSSSVPGEPPLSRGPTLQTLDITVTTPPPGYDSDFQQQQLSQRLQANNMPAVRPRT